MTNSKPNGKIAFITGANRGLGLQTARELGKTGTCVVIGSRDPQKGEAAAAKLCDEGIPAESLDFDVTKSQDDHQKAYDYFAKKYGRSDILVNNAGVWLEDPPPKVASIGRRSDSSPRMTPGCFNKPQVKNPHYEKHIPTIGNFPMPGDFSNWL
jgi:NAD(P)-dependent dehydrogenase (short-subunit alcohol dehydrogenase family)